MRIYSFTGLSAKITQVSGPNLKTLSSHVIRPAGAIMSQYKRSSSVIRSTQSTALSNSYSSGSTKLKNPSKRSILSYLNAKRTGGTIMADKTTKCPCLSQAISHHRICRLASRTRAWTILTKSCYTWARSWVSSSMKSSSARLSTNLGR